MGQSLTMTPALQQAIRLLQLSSLDLQLEIQQALESNLMLDLAEPEAVDVSVDEAEAEGADDAPAAEEVHGDAEQLPEDLPVDADWSDLCDLDPSPASGTPDEDLQNFLDANLKRSTSLYDHLLEQLQLAELDPREAEIGLHLIDAIDADGYLRDWPELIERLPRLYELPSARVEAVLDTVQDFDPAGVGARDLAECLRLQLWQCPARTPGVQAALRLVDQHLPLLSQRDPAVIARQARLSLAAVQEALGLIRSLQPHPGRPFAAHESDYIAPDVFVVREKGRWRVHLNPDHLPRLRINSAYQRHIKRADHSPDQLTLKGHLQEARYFINALESRNETLLRVAQTIVEAQRGFLEYGDEAMRPLVLRDVSEQLGIHESTVSRATANKYLATPRGLFELKYFFSSHVTTTEGGTASATAIQAMIKRLISAEGVDKPLSDAALSEHLLKEGIQVARRTVAKYREGLGIPPSHERRGVWS
jgi:RNA polymerase sigma-54 factor